MSQDGQHDVEPQTAEGPGLNFAALSHDQLREDSLDTFAEFGVAGLPPPGVVPGVFPGRKDETQGGIALIPDDLWLSKFRPSAVQLVAHRHVVKMSGAKFVLHDFSWACHPGVQFVPIEPTLSAVSPPRSRKGTAFGALGTTERLSGKRLGGALLQIGYHFSMSRRPTYPTDTSDVQWAILGSLIPAPRPGGRPAHIARRDIVDAIFYVKREGVSWRLLPADFPHWKTVYDYFRQWKQSGLWERVNDALRVQTRQALGRNAVLTAGIVDSRSVRTSQKGGHAAMTVARRSTDEHTT
jgi:transposase